MKRNISINYMYNLFYQVLVVIIPFATAPYLSRVLGAEKIGEYSFANSIVYYFILFAALGTATYGRREISYLQDDKEKRSIKFWETELISCISVITCLFIYLIFLYFKESTSLYYILAIDILSVGFDISWFFQGMEEFGKIIFRNIIFKMINLIYIFTMVKTKSDLNLYVLGLSIFTLISNMSLWFYIKKYIYPLEIRKINIKKSIIPLLSLFIPTIAVFLSSSIDKTMIGIFCNDAKQNGYYEQMMKLVKIMLAFITSMAVVISPRIGYLNSNGKTKMIKKYMYNSYKFVFLLGYPICFGIIILANDFVPWFYGNDFMEASVILQILSFLALLIGLNNVTGTQYLIPLKRQNDYTKSVTLGAILNILLNFILIPKFYATGAAIASVISELCVSVLQFYLIKDVINFIKIIKSGNNYLISSIVMTLSLFLINTVFNVSSIIVLVVFGIVIYFIQLIILNDIFMMTILYRFSSKLKQILKAKRQ